jgi:integrase/recombinase XerC
MDIQVRNFLRYLYLERRYSSKTVEAYGIDLLQFETFLSDYLKLETIPWEKVDKRGIRLFLIILQDGGISKRSIARKLATIKSFFKYLAREEIIDQNPSLTIKIPKFEKKLPAFATLEDIDRLMTLPDTQTFEGIRDRAILELFYGTGMRLTELINLKLSDVMLSENLIRVHGKGNKERVIPLGNTAKEVLNRYLSIRAKYAGQSVDTIFVLKSGKKIYPMAVQRIVKKYLSQSSHTHQQSPHILRHSYATHLLNAGANIRVVKDLLGHESLSTTQVYTHLSVDHLKKVYDKAHPGAIKDK